MNEYFFYSFTMYHIACSFCQYNKKIKTLSLQSTHFTVLESPHSFQASNQTTIPELPDLYVKIF